MNRVTNRSFLSSWIMVLAWIPLVMLSTHYFSLDPGKIQQENYQDPQAENEISGSEKAFPEETNTPVYLCEDSFFAASQQLVFAQGLCPIDLFFSQVSTELHLPPPKALMA